MAALTEVDWLLVGGAAVAAGAVNALAGGGTLISFPLLTAAGIPPVIANVTNTVALCPGYLAAALAQSRDLAGQGGRLALYLPIGTLGGLAGGYLLLHTTEQTFRTVVPYLILLASGLLAIQEPLRGWLLRRARLSRQTRALEILGTLPTFLASIYGGYFGAGVSVVVLAMLGLALDDSLTRLNALKQGISFSINVAAAVFFCLFGTIHWPAFWVMAVGALVGGALGGQLAGRIPAAALRWLVVAFGLVIAVVYFIRGL
ncbi:sulfite exporter TauE/SafE family protein [Candidatus Methylocalor cossyra]|uniref:Probable membrane transporter protein n=1 Tax=Candidatus Methylocalor cossyra TaxID=3108543 RepID=A0ABM9NE00_9GAMM